MSNDKKASPSRLKQLFALIRRENLHQLLLFIIVLVLLGGVGMMLTEDRSFIDSLWWAIVTLTTVGFGDIAPASLGGRIIGVVLMVFGIGVLGMFTATVAGMFVEQRLKKERGMGAFDLSDHIILCEWNDYAEQILRDLRSDPRCGNRPIVLLANIETKPVDDQQLYFVKGAVTEDNLKRCCIDKAANVLIVGDRSLDVNSRDAKVVLSTLAVETLNPDAYTIVELASEANAKHCERAKADEVIISSEFSSRLMSSATMDHGITKVLSELISPHFGSDMVHVAVPEKLAGKTFLDVFAELKRESNQIVVALERGTDGEVLTNPPADLGVESNDRLFVICSKDSPASAAAH